MTMVPVAPHVGVRLDAEERTALAEIARNLRSDRNPRVSVSDAIRAAIREFHAALIRERGAADAV